MKTNIYESYRPLVEDWKPYIDVVKEHVEGYNDVEATQLAIVLENTKSELESATGRLKNGFVSEATDISMINTFSSNAFEIVTAVFPNLIANDIVSTQPLDRRNGQVFFLKFTYGNAKGGIQKGDNMLTSKTGFSGKDYSGEHVSGEILTITEGAVDHTLAYLPVIPGTVKLTSGVAGVLKDVPNADGLTGTFTASGDTSAASNGMGTGTINYATGKITLSGVTVTDLAVEWDYDLNSFNAKVGEIDVQVACEAVVARPRKLKSVYMFDVGYDLKQSFGLDMDTIILKATSGEIGYEIDNEIMQDLLVVAGTSSTWNKNPEYKGMEKVDHDATFLTAIHDASNTILGATKRYEATFVICGKNGATLIESMNSARTGVFKRVSTGGIVGGPHLVGVLDEKYKVYKNPFYGDNDVLVGAKGEMFIEAGYIYAPYLPLFASQLLVDADFKAQRGFCTLYAKKVTNPNMYHRITLIDNVSVTDSE